MVFREVEFELTPKEAGQMFAQWDADMQAEFLSAVAAEAQKWPGAGWCNQSYFIVRQLDASGKDVVRSLADHFASYFGWTPSA